MAGVLAFSNMYAAILTPQEKEDYRKRLEIQPGLAAVMNIPEGLTPQEEEALKFLYAYMATPDVTDYDTDFYLDNIRTSLRATEEMPWGERIPEREWRHFVLPVRVNNENLDNSRQVFYEELKERVKGLSMEEAILEVNHWCHEKVSYQPSDARTSSPLATVGNALGRCGEESTFTVAALRSVGIPARQVYTPRWAHTDDNHAWVEAWADGKWHFLGACEPEAVLDLAWFNAPASRGMLMTTKVTGSYDGAEEKLETTPITTVINVTENYAPVVTSTVQVLGGNGEPVDGAKVRFGLYNYAEFYPLVVKVTDKEGNVSFTSGIGDLVVWATDGNSFNYSELKAGEHLVLPLDKTADFTGATEFDLTPPAPGGNLPSVTPEAALLNDRRKAYEDSIRLAYVNTFLSPQTAGKIAAELGLGEKAADLLVKSRGNHAIILDFLRNTPPESRPIAVELLGAIAEKDLHDITPDVLADNLNFTQGDPSSPLYSGYILNPRIEYEMLRPFKEVLSDRLDKEKAEAYRQNPASLAEDIEKQIQTDSLFNPGQFRQSAVSTFRYGLADSFNKSLAFVSVARSLGIPARIDPVTHSTQYADPKGNWQDVSFNEKVLEESASNKGWLEIQDMSQTNGRQPKYYSQFTISKIKDGMPELMEFDDFESVESINRRKEPLTPGQYMIVSGQRLADGSVLARSEIFKVNPGQTTEVPLIVRQDTTALQVIGSLDAELLFTPLQQSAAGFREVPSQSILATTGRGYYALGIIMPGHEPSAHALNDIAAAAEELAATGRKILLLFPDAEALAKFRPEDYGQLPENVVFGLDNGSILSGLKDGLEMETLTASEMPLFVVADTFNRIVFLRKGYSIHLGETLARILSSVE